MGKVLATYHVKLTIRELDEPDPDAARREVPTNAAVEAAVEGAIAGVLEDGCAVNATSERTDI